MPTRSNFLPQGVSFPRHGFGLAFLAGGKIRTALGREAVSCSYPIVRLSERAMASRLARRAKRKRVPTQNWWATLFAALLAVHLACMSAHSAVHLRSRCTPALESDSAASTQVCSQAATATALAHDPLHCAACRAHHDLRCFYGAVIAGEVVALAFRRVTFLPENLPAIVGGTNSALSRAPPA